MDAVKFIEERNRMCNSFGDRCTGCPASNACGCCAVDQASTLDATDQVAIVEDWSKEHQIKTRNSEFLKNYPNAINCEGVICICPKLVDESYNPCNGCSKTPCDECKEEYWTQEVE